MSYFKELFDRLCDTKESRFILDLLNDWIEKFSESIDVNSVILFAAGAAVALVIALFGLKLSKPLVAFAFGVAGCMAGSHLFVLLNDKFNWMFSDLTQVALGSVCGLLVAIPLMFLSYKLIRLMFAILMTGVGFLASLYFMNDKYIIAAAIALGAFILSLLLYRVLFVLLTAGGGVILAFNLLSAALPKVTYLDWNDNWTAFAIAMGVVLVCIIIQCLPNRRRKKKAEETKEVEETPEEKPEEKPENQPARTLVWEYRKGYIIPFEFD